MSAIPTASPTYMALSLIRNPEITVAQLAQHFQESENFAAGLIDALTGEIDWRAVWHFDDAVPTHVEREDYERGFRTAERLLNVERYGEPTPVVSVVAPNPAPAWDIPF